MWRDWNGCSSSSGSMKACAARPRVFLHAALLPWLHQRVADYPGALAEGGVNFWEAFRLVPCTRGFWLDGLWFDIFATRHHVPGTSWGLALRGSFAYTGDTRPIPEILLEHAGGDELIAHDCGLVGNPSHTGVEDIEREYPPICARDYCFTTMAAQPTGSPSPPRFPLGASRRACLPTRLLTNPPKRQVELLAACLPAPLPLSFRFFARPEAGREVTWRGVRVVEGARLESVYRVYSLIEGSNPSLSARFR